MVCKTFILVCLLISVINCTDQRRCESSCDCKDDECCIRKDIDRKQILVLTGDAVSGFCRDDSDRCDPECKQCRCEDENDYCDPEGYCQPRSTESRGRN